MQILLLCYLATELMSDRKHDHQHQSAYTTVHTPVVTMTTSLAMSANDRSEHKSDLVTCNVLFRQSVLEKQK